MPLIEPKKILDGDSTPGAEIRALLTQVTNYASGNVYEATLTPAQVLALSATPITVLPAPGANKAYLVERVEVFKAAGTAYAGIATTEDLTLKYTNGSGTVLATVETTGFLDQATAQTRSVRGVATDITPVANAPVVAHIPTGEITTGNSPLKLRILAQIIDTVF